MTKAFREEFDDKIKFYEVDCIKYEALKAEHEVGERGWPTIKYFNQESGVAGGHYERKVFSDVPDVADELGDFSRFQDYVEDKSELQLSRRLVGKHDPKTGEGQEHPDMEIDWSRRFKKLYEQYNPKKVQDVYKILEKYRGIESAVWTKMLEKYNVNEKEWIENNEGGVEIKANIISPDEYQEEEEPEEREQDVDWLDVFTKFYMKHAPSKVGKVQEILKKYEGEEDIVYREMLKKYGVAPGGVPQSAEVKGRPIPQEPKEAPQAKKPANEKPKAATKNWQAVFTNFYRQHAPEKLDKVHNILMKYSGHEERVYRELKRKYGVEDDDEVQVDDEDQVDDGEVDWKSKFLTFYLQYAPEKVGKVDALLTKYKGHEERVYGELLRKYDVDPNDIEGGAPIQPPSPSGSPVITPTPAPVPTKAPKAPKTPKKPVDNEWKDLFVRFYKEFKPENIAKVDYLLQKYAGNESQLWDATREKYGVPRWPDTGNAIQDRDEL